MSKEYIVDGEVLTSMANSIRTLSNTEETYTVDEMATTLSEITEAGVTGKNETLTFTGAVSATYDGSKPVEVEIPEGGASITVDDALSPDSTNPVQNKVIFAYLEEATNVLEQIQGSIPSDEHINDLINAALGVIENGSY